MKATTIMVFIFGLVLVIIGASYAMDNPDYGGPNTFAGIVILLGVVLVIISILRAWGEEQSVGRGKSEIQPAS